MDATTIQVPNKVKNELDRFKGHPRETYADVINRLIEMAREGEESRLELSIETLKGIKQAKEDIRKGRVYTTAQVKKELGL
jgi:predicted CopG family antitoxin